MLLVLSGLLSRAAADPVAVSSSAELAVALVNPNTTEVLIKIPLRSPGVGIHILLEDVGTFLVLPMFSSSDSGCARALVYYH